MKKTIFCLFAATLIFATISGCEKNIYGCTDPAAYNYAPNANVDNGSCVYYGNIEFWCAQNEGVVTVNISNQTANINGYISGVTFDVNGNVISGTPDCNNAVSATFSLPVGTYSFSATSTNGNTWHGTAYSVQNGCKTYLLN